MSRPRSLLWPRITSKIDHPDAQLIPLLAHEEQDDWPPSLKDAMWNWTGATTAQGAPVLQEKGVSLSVTRLVYTRLIGPLSKNHRLLTAPYPLNLNPRFHTPHLLTRNVLPAPTTVSAPPPCFADEFDVDDVADRLDEMNPKDISDLHRKWPTMGVDYYPTQVFEALKKANLAARLGVTSPLELVK
jgi:hypothetical protein